jgi:hypothetical protein
VVGELEFFGRGLEGEEVEGLFEAEGEFEGRALELHLAGLDFGEIEDVVDDGEEGFAGGADGVDEVALLAGERGLHEEAGHADDAVHGRADFVRHGGEELALGAGGFVGLVLGAAELGLGLDAGGDVGLDGDKILDFPGGAADGLDFEVEVVFAAGLGVVDDVGADAEAARHGGADTDQGADIGLGADEEVGGVFADDFFEAVFHDAAEGFVGPLDAAVGGADEDGVVGLGGDEREFAGFGLGFAEGELGFAAGGDVLHRADDAGGAAIGAGGDGLGAGVDPAPIAAAGAHAILGLDEGGDAVELGFGAAAVERQIVVMDERLPGLDGGGHAAVFVAEHGPEAGAVVDVAGGDGPFEDTDLRGIEGEAEAFVGNFETGFDAAAFFVFGKKFFIGELGGALAGAGAAGEVERDAEENRDAEAGEEGELGEEAAVLIEGIVGRREAEADAEAGDGDGAVDGHLVVARGVGDVLVEDVLAAEGDGDVVIAGEGGGEGGDRGLEHHSVDVFGAGIADEAVAAEDRGVDDEAVFFDGFLGVEHLQRRGEDGGAVVGAAGDLEGVAALLDGAVFEADGGFVARKRMDPTGAERGVDEGDFDAAEFIGDGHGGGGIGLEDGADGVGIFAPLAGETFDLGGLRIEGIADLETELGERRMGALAEDGALAIAETDPEDDGERQTADDRGHRGPRRRAAFGPDTGAPREDDERTAHEEQTRGGDRRRGGGGAPVVNGREIGDVAEERGETGGGEDGAGDGFGEEAGFDRAIEGAPSERKPGEHEARGDEGGHAAGLVGVDEEVVADEEFVDEQVGAGDGLEERGQTDEGGDESEEREFAAAGGDREEDAAEQHEAEGGIGLHRGQVALHGRQVRREAQHFVHMEPPAEEGDGAEEHQQSGEEERHALEPRAAWQCREGGH